MKLNIYKSIPFLGIFLLSVNVMQAVSPEDKFKEANTLYEASKYNEALEMYAELVEENYISAALYYNLGNAYFRSNRNVEAILYYEKALKINPRNPDYRHNLAVANHKMENKQEQSVDFFINVWWRNMASFLSSTGWSIVALLLFWGGIAAILLWMFAAKRKQKKIGFFMAPVLVLMSIIPFLLAGSRADFIENSVTAIIMEEGKQLKSAPDSKVDVVPVAAGTKVKLLDVIGDWEKVKLPEGEIGWLKESALEKI